MGNKRQKVKNKKRSMIKIIGIILTILATLTIISGIVMYKAAKSTGIGSGKVADYDKRVNIWNDVAGNSSRSKLEDMNIDKNGNLLLSTIQFGDAIVSDKYEDK